MNALNWLLGLALAFDGAPQTCTLPPTSVSSIATVGLVTEQETLIPVVNRAIALWAQCPGHGSDFPQLLALKKGQRTVSVEHRRVNRESSCGSFAARKIVLYDMATENGRRLSCGSLSANLAHEIGHVLRLPDLDNARCGSHRIMAELQPGNGFTREVTARDCRAAGSQFLIPLERDWAVRMGLLDDEGLGLPSLQVSLALDRHRDAVGPEAAFDLASTGSVKPLVWAEI